MVVAMPYSPQNPQFPFKSQGARHIQREKPQSPPLGSHRSQTLLMRCCPWPLPVSLEWPKQWRHSELHEISDGPVVGKLMDILMYNCKFIVMSSDGLINQIKYCDFVVRKAYGLIYLDLDPRNCPAFFVAFQPAFLSQPKTPIQRCRCVTWEWFIPCGRATWNAP